MQDLKFLLPTHVFYSFPSNFFAHQALSFHFFVDISYPGPLKIFNLLMPYSPPKIFLHPSLNPRARIFQQVLKFTHFGCHHLRFGCIGKIFLMTFFAHYPFFTPLKIFYHPKNFLTSKIFTSHNFLYTYPKFFDDLFLLITHFFILLSP